MYNLLIIVSIFGNINLSKSSISISTELTTSKYTYEECIKESKRISKTERISQYGTKQISTECILIGK